MKVDALSCSKDGAGDRVRTGDVQLGKSYGQLETKNIAFPASVLAIEIKAFSPCGSASCLTEHKRSTRYVKKNTFKNEQGDSVPLYIPWDFALSCQG